MRINKSLFVIGVSLVTMTGCHSMSGNVVPQTGPSMEQVYDSMGSHKSTTQVKNFSTTTPSVKSARYAEEDVRDIRRNTVSQSRAYSTASSGTKGMGDFRKLPNPDLTLYVYPHVAGQEEVLIPGYYTEFNVYERTHYALPSDILRE